MISTIFQITTLSMIVRSLVSSVFVYILFIIKYNERCSEKKKFFFIINEGVTFLFFLIYSSITFISLYTMGLTTCFILQSEIDNCIKYYCLDVGILITIFISILSTTVQISNIFEYFKIKIYCIISTICTTIENIFLIFSRPKDNDKKNKKSSKKGFLGRYPHNIIKKDSSPIKNLRSRGYMLHKLLSNLPNKVFIVIVLTFIPFITTLTHEIYNLSDRVPKDISVHTEQTRIGDIPFSLMNELAIAILNIMINKDRIWFEYQDVDDDIKKCHYEVHVDNKYFKYCQKLLVNLIFSTNEKYIQRSDNTIWVYNTIVNNLRDFGFVYAWFNSKYAHIFMLIAEEHESISKKEEPLTIFLDCRLYYYIFPLLFDNAAMFGYSLEQKYDEVKGDPIYLKCILLIPKYRIFSSLFHSISTVISNNSHSTTFNLHRDTGTGIITIEMCHKRKIVQLYRTIRKNPIYKLLYHTTKYYLIV